MAVRSRTTQLTREGPRPASAIPINGVLVLSDNLAMRAVFPRSGYRMASRAGDGVVELKLLLEEPVVDPSGGAMGPQGLGRHAASHAVESRSETRARRSSGEQRR